MIEFDLPPLSQQHNVGAFSRISVALHDEAVRAEGLADAIRDDLFDAAVLTVEAGGA